jgi:hypothetical protein
LRAAWKSHSLLQPLSAAPEVSSVVTHTHSLNVHREPLHLHLQCSRIPHSRIKVQKGEQPSRVQRADRQRELLVRGTGREIRGVPPWPTRRGPWTPSSRSPSTW